MASKYMRMMIPKKRQSSGTTAFYLLEADPAMERKKRTDVFFGHGIKWVRYPLPEGAKSQAPNFK
jgi:hypothetical protein